MKSIIELNCVSSSAISLCFSHFPSIPPPSIQINTHTHVLIYVQISDFFIHKKEPFWVVANWSGNSVFRTK